MANFPSTLTHGSGRPLELDSTRLLLSFDPPGRPANFEKVLAHAGLLLEDAPVEGKPKARVNQTPRFCFVRSKNGEPVPRNAPADLMAALGNAPARKPRLKWVGPVYRFVGNPTDAGLLGVVIDSLRLTPTAPVKDDPNGKLSKLLKKLALEPNAKLSKAIAPTRFVEATNLGNRHAIAAAAELSEALAGTFSAHPVCIPLRSPECATPSSESQWPQWNMIRIGAEAAWDRTKGSTSVCVCVVDKGVQRAHEELNRASSYGHDAGTGVDHGGYITTGTQDVSDNTTSAHGTGVASVTSGAWDSGGVAGLAGDAALLALAVPNWLDTEVEAAIKRAFDGTKPPTAATVALDQRVLLLPFVHDLFAIGPIKDAVETALNSGLTVVCASGDDADTSTYPADGSHPRAIVCGASDDVDARYNSKFPSFLSLVAPGKDIPVAVPGPGLGATTYGLLQGSSCGAAHVAGAVALVLSRSAAGLASYPFGSTNPEKLKSVIERTAQKVGTGYGSEINPRTPELGFGRLRADWAVDLADVMIKDDPADRGVEPSTGVFWRDSAVVIRQTAESQAIVEASFDTWHADPMQSTRIYASTSGASCYAYVRVQNLGPASAENVRVRAVGAACATGFMYPTDWNAADDVNHFVMSPNPWPGDPAAVGDEYVVGSLAAGAAKIVRFEITKAKADKGLAWPGSHVCGLAKVTANNDHAFNMFAPAVPVSSEQARRNNLCQRNLHVVTAASPWFFPFLAGNVVDEDETMELVIEAKSLPSGTLMRLALDEPERAAPNLDLSALSRSPRAAAAPRAGHASLTLLDRARVAIGCGDTIGIATLPPGTQFDCSGGARGDVRVTGGSVITSGGKRLVETRGAHTRVRLPKAPGSVLPLYLEIPVPAGVKKTDRFLVDVIQKNAAGQVVGGVSLYLVP
ncbi:MAG: S8 family serine peptidase [Myxococcales bacterium]|nr:S8 family serine peptidase [Myxococcales bacterium]